jgi:predicted AlkP superfamily pyrophosphatase or phosphodiesterase
MRASLSWLRLVLASSLISIAQLRAADGLGTNHIVVMISVDGLAASYLDDPKAEMPNIRALAADGARAKSMKATTPTVTWPNHTTLVTGMPPAKHGVVGNNYFDRLTKKRVTLISDPVFDKEEIVKVPTIYDIAKAKGLKTASIRWPATRNANSLDWAMPDVGTKALLSKYSTPSLIQECERAGLTLDQASKDKVNKKTPDGNHVDLDTVYTRIFNLILREHHPELGLLHIINVDHMQHLHGPQSAEAYAAIKAADQRVGDVWEELKRDYPGQATLLVVSDHGFSPINRMILPNVILRNAGIVQTNEPKNKADVFILPQGGSAFVYICTENNRKQLLKQVRHAFTGMEGVASVIGVEKFKKYGVADPKADPHAPDLILFAKLGYAFGDTAAGALPFQDKPERNGSHGHDPNLPELHATFVAWGEGIKPGVRLGEISNYDVAPTIARLLHIRFDADGRPLKRILVD